MRIFRGELSTTKKVIEFLTQYQKLNSISASENCINPDLTKKNPNFALALKLHILKSVYNQEYYTDSGDFERLAYKILNKDEQIWFWGGKEQIQLTKSYLNSGKIPIEFGEFNLGTISFINSASEYGLGVCEECRAGSLESVFGAKNSMVLRYIDYLTGVDCYNYNNFHTIISLPRNRKSTKSVRGGEAIHTIEVKYINSRFWGFAPWYVMPENKIEMLDFRETNRNIEDVISKVASTSIYLANKNEIEFVRLLYQVNLNIIPSFENVSKSNFEKANQKIYFKVLISQDKSIIHLNHGTLVAEYTNDGLSLEQGLNFLETIDVCTMVVKLPLEDPQTLNFQKIIHERGFRLTSIIPAKKTWIKPNSTIINIETQAFGFWSLPNQKFEIELPFYVDINNIEKDENEIRNYLLSYLV